MTPPSIEAQAPLLPCPFCGGEAMTMVGLAASLNERYGKITHRWGNSKCPIRDEYFERSAWNTRAPAPALSPEVEGALRMAVKALGDLSFECDGIDRTKAPSRETYNRTFDVLQQCRETLVSPTLRSQSTPLSAPTVYCTCIYNSLPRPDTHEPGCPAAPVRSQEEREATVMKFTFYVDNIRFETNSRSLPGSEVKKIAGVTPTYRLFEYGKENKYDYTWYGDAHAIDLTQEEKWLYAIPPATM